MAQFISLFYMPYFFRTRLSSEAPRHDLTSWKHMGVYKKYDKDIADEVKKSINCQLWYLTEECIVFCLFDDGVDDVEKNEICQSLLSIPRPDEFSPRKPKFPDQILAHSPNTFTFILHLIKILASFCFARKYWNLVK